MQQLAIKGTYRSGVIAPENPITYDEDTEVIVVLPIREDTALIFERVENEEIRLIFKDALKVNLTIDDNLLFLKYSTLDIRAYGQDLREVTQAFQDIFISTFAHYSAQSDELLTTEAQNLKKALQDLVHEQVKLTEVEE